MGESPVRAESGATVLPLGVLPLTAADPECIGNHRLVGRLGAGGMGVVYLGRARNGRLAAVKVAHAGLSGEEEVRDRMRAEVACLSRVPAHCTARLLVDGTDQMPPYVITEYVAGRSLKDVIERDGPLPLEQLLALATGVLRALTAIHRAGLVHRDLKPANVLLTPTGPRVIDFGIAQDIDAAGGPTGTDTVVGSIGWIAPERLTRKPTTPASDIFCWGCLITYAGTGHNPFGAGDPVEIARRAIFEAPDLDGLDPSLQRHVAAALSKTPAERPVAENLLERLATTAPLPTLDNTITSAHPLEQHRSRTKTLAAAAGMVALAASVVTSFAASDPQKAIYAGDGPAAAVNHPAPATASAATTQVLRPPAGGEHRKPSSPDHRKTHAGHRPHVENHHGKKGHGRHGH